MSTLIYFNSLFFSIWKTLKWLIDSAQHTNFLLGLVTELKDMTRLAGSCHLLS